MRIKLDVNEVWERAYSSDDLNEEEAMVAKTIEKARSWGDSWASSTKSKMGESESETIGDWDKAYYERLNVGLQARIVRSAMEYYHDSSEKGLKWCLESALNDWACPKDV
jgi:hypothetical protein